MKAKLLVFKCDIFDIAKHMNTEPLEVELIRAEERPNEEVYTIKAIRQDNNQQKPKL